VLPAAETTSVLTHAADPDPAIDELPSVAGERARRKIRPLSILAVAVTLVVALIGAVFWVTAASVPGSPPALAEVGEPLGSHLQLLLEQVTP
jgi:hypothetical protein